MPFQLFGRGEASSLSLAGFDAATGRLKILYGPVRFEAVLPEDAVFDADGDIVAIAVFNEKAASPKAGWIAYFRVDRASPNPRLVPLSLRTPTPLGAHDLALIP